MTRPTRRDVDNRLGELEDRNGADGEIFVVTVGGDPDLPRGWLTREEYHEHYADARDEPSAFEWHFEPDGAP